MNEKDQAIYDMRFEHPSSFLIAGSSGSGKSYFVKNLIRNIEFLFKSKIERIVWCYTQAQPFFNDPALKMVEFVKGFDPDLYKRNEVPTFLCLDDMMTETANCKELPNFFTKNRHMNLSVAFLTQNLFAQNPVQRTMSLNANYLIVMKMIRDRKQVSTLVGQMFPTQQKFAKEAILRATKNPYSYAIIDTKPSTPDNLRIRGRIFPEEWNDFYAQEVFTPE